MDENVLLRFIAYLGLDITVAAFLELLDSIKRSACAYLDTVKTPVGTYKKVTEELNYELTKQIQEDCLVAIKESDSDLLIVNYNTECSPMCRGAQNKVYSLSGRNKKYRKFSNYHFNVQGWEEGHALLHPYCKHWIESYYEGLTDDPVEEFFNESDAIKVYEDIEKVRQAGYAYKKYLNYEKADIALGVDPTKNKQLKDAWRNRFNDLKRKHEAKWYPDGRPIY